ncbi:hypothetical protein HRI_004014600 [Hibiscus trionum]|uniref:HMA domain-containing protein n=1 Tax=Hibiscus trionum TaxID=183268 RepID=A0A9W7IY85_HIBTR|nr:hypothetical protein HRI_004014600 [Hibiscus trionum]
MESALSTTPFSNFKTLNLHFPNPKSPLFTPIASLSYPSPLRISASSIPKRSHRRLRCLGSSAGGGSFGGDDGSSGGGGDGGGGEGTGDGGSEAKLGLGAAEDLSVLPSDVVILHVEGMTCGGCASKVKKILESQPQVSSASVDLATETAIVWPVSEAKATPNWQNELGEALAKHLTTCGFKSNLRVAATIVPFGQLLHKFASKDDSMVVKTTKLFLRINCDDFTVIMGRLRSLRMLMAFLFYKTCTRFCISLQNGL